ncbi:MAG TPA: response regulator transcription factor [Anaerolineaceae bacterium]|nr:response regulator transcription factor [Anaerolineaceae bacterium]
MAGEAILVVDDEPNIVQLAQLYLAREGYRVLSAGDGNTALKVIGQEHPALMVLDVMLPELDGFEVCRRLRAENNPTPILMVTARDDDIDKILGLELGADDYMTKPFNPRELVARVKAILRRGERANRAVAGGVPIHLGDLVIDPEAREARIKNGQLDLRTQEFEVLFILAQHRGQVLSREKLLSLAWGYDFYGQTRTVDVHIAQLRKKLSGSNVHIETVTGIGYKLVV